MASVPPTISFYAGLALILAVLAGYIAMVALGKSGKWFMQDIGLYILYVGASLLGVSLPIMFTPGTAGG